MNILAISAGSKMIEHGQQTSGKNLNRNAQFHASTIKPIAMVLKRNELGGMVA